MDKSKNKINCLSSSKMHIQKKKKHLTFETAKLLGVHTTLWSQKGTQVSLSCTVLSNIWLFVYRERSSVSHLCSYFTPQF